jgi:hypothetical protein
VIFFESANAGPAVKKNSTERTATSATEHDPFIAPPPEFEILTDAARAISTEPKILPTERTIGDLNICVKGEVREGKCLK